MTMHNFVSRANALFAYAFSCIAIATFFCFATAYFENPQPKINLSVNDAYV